MVSTASQNCGMPEFRPAASSGNVTQKLPIFDPFEPLPVLPFALAYHRLGLSVFPLKGRSKEPALPTWSEWQQQRPDEDQVRFWFQDVDASQLGIAIVCGAVSGGLLVCDFDQKRPYNAWRKQNQDLVTTLPIVNTRRAAHFYARCEGYKAASDPTFRQNYADGDLRGDGHYVVAPPSIHPDKVKGQPVVYSWASGLVPNQIPKVSPDLFGIASSQGDVTQEIVSVLHGWQVSDDVLQAIADTKPQKRGERHRLLFQFARRLRSLSQYRDCDDPHHLRPLVEAWHRVAQPYIGTKDFITSMNEFARGWPYVKYASGEGSLQAALQRAHENELPPEANGLEPVEKVLLLALCRELQVERGARAFYLGCRQAAKSIGMNGPNDHIKAHRWLQEFQRAGWLSLVSVGSQVRRKANEYRYLLPLE